MNSEKTKKGGGCWCCSILSLGLTSFSLYYYFHTSTPTFFIEKFDVFALNEPTTNNPSLKNNTIYYDMEFKNRMFNKGIYYDSLNLTFYYKPNNLSTFPIGNATFSPFYQGRKKATQAAGSIVKPRGVKRENSTALVVFRVDLATALRYKGTFGKSRRYHLVVGADFKVNGQGSLVKKEKKGIKLRSGVGKTSKSSFEMMGVLFLMIFLLI